VHHHASFWVSQAAATGTSRGCTDPGQYPPVRCECKLFSRVIKNIFTPADSELTWSFSNNMSETHPDRSWYFHCTGSHDTLGLRDLRKAPRIYKVLALFHQFFQLLSQPGSSNRNKQKTYRPRAIPIRCSRQSIFLFSFPTVCQKPGIFLISQEGTSIIIRKAYRINYCCVFECNIPYLINWYKP
jgi:hypothetical protein